MGQDRWKEIDDLFQQALDLRSDQQRLLLEALDERDGELRRAVEALLHAAEASGDFLQTPVEQACAPPWDEVFSLLDGDGRLEPRDRSGERVGPYRLVRCLGRGGMATVYLAERADGLWEQQVALKLIRLGLDSEDVVRRFLAERQILSSLRHPNIANLLDGGTTDEGLPYLVMEYVRGTPITQYCDERRLPIGERLRLFCEVGRAVQHAHRSLIVHRDLKPSNILVTDQQRVKLLDFGIAKLLDPESRPEAEGLTRPGHLPLTPEYASPEQLAGGPITTASDVYQLGVLLYRLLCGRRPHGLERVWYLDGLRRDERPRPDPPSDALLTAPPTGSAAGGSTERDAADLASRRGTSPDRLSRRLRGDLDMIVVKALRPAPDERYGSVAALVEDVERHMEELPIRARPPTRRYRLRKFLGRNRWVAPVATGALVVTGLYTFSMAHQTKALERERNAARAEAERADETRDFMATFFRSADPFAPADPERGRTITVVEALELGADRVRSELVDQPALQADLFGTIAEVYASLDLDERAAGLRREALDRARRTHGPGSAEVARHLRALGRLATDVGTRDSAEVLLRNALTLTGNLYGERDTAYAAVLTDLGYLASAQGEHDAAARHLEQAVSILEASEPPPERQLAAALGVLTSVYPHLNRPDEAVRVGRRALEYVERTYGEDHPRTAIAMVRLAGTYDWLEETSRGIELYRSAIPIMERTLGEDHAETMNSLNNLAVSLMAADEVEQAEEVLRRVLEIRIRKFGEEHEEVGDALQNLAATLNLLGRTDEAEAALTQAYDIYTEALEPDHYQTAFPLLTLSEIQLERGSFAEAEASASEATRILRGALPDGHYARAVAECRWGRALAGLGRTRQATPLLEDAATALMTAPRGGRHREACLEAAAGHLRGIGVPAARWAPFVERLEELRTEGPGVD